MVQSRTEQTAAYSNCANQQATHMAAASYPPQAYGCWGHPPTSSQSLPQTKRTVLGAMVGRVPRGSLAPACLIAIQSSCSVL
jgi:hypothetical protein